MEKMRINIMLEVLGRPPENVKEALQNMATRIGAEKGIKVLAKQVHEPIPVQDTKDLYTSFVEMELELDNMESYINLIFTYMPSNIEFISPEVIEIKNTFMNEISHAITQRLHHYDAIAKQMLAEKEVILKQLYQYAPHLFKKQEQPINVSENPSQESKKVKEIKKNKKSKKKKK